jgi:hypothetical protein
MLVPKREAPQQLHAELTLPRQTVASGKRLRYAGPDPVAGGPNAPPRTIWGQPWPRVPTAAPAYLPPQAKQAPNATNKPPVQPGAAMTPDKAHGWVDVAPEEFAAVYAFFEDNDIIGAALSKLEESTTSGGVDVRLEEFDQPIELTEEHKEFLDDEFMHHLRLCQLYKLLFGVYVVRIGISPDYPNETTAYVVPFNKFKLSFIEGSGVAGRRYKVSYTDTDEFGQFESDEGFLVQDNPNNRGFPLFNGRRHSLIFAPYPPTSNGHLQGRIALLLWRVKLERNLFAANDYGAHWIVRPLHALEVSKNAFGDAGSLQQTVGALDYLAEGDIRGEQQKYRVQRSVDEQRQYEYSSEQARKRVSANWFDANVNPATATGAKAEHARLTARLPTQLELSVDANPNGLISPFEHSVTLPPNQTLRPGPSIGAPPNFEAVIDRVFDVIFMVLNIPPMVLNSRDSRHAADAQLAMDQYEEKVQQLQADLSRAAQIM